MKKNLCILLVGMIIILGGCISIQIKQNSEQSTEKNSVESLVVDATVQATEESIEKVTESEIVDDKPVIAFTFDDGPSLNTDRLLDILKKNNVKASFFVVGNRIAGSEATLKRIVDEGHDIGSHTWDHVDLTTLKNKEIKNEMNKTKDEIFEVTGYKTNLLRPPYGAWNQQVKKIAKKQGISIINWNIDTEDWKTKNKKKIAKLIMKEARDGSIILSHDLYDATVDAMEIVIPKLIKKGYQIVTVTDLLESNDGKVEAGMVYYNRWQSK